MFRKIAILIILAFYGALLHGQDPFEESETATIDVTDERRLTPSGWRSAFGLKKWSLDDWPKRAEIEIRIFHARQGEPPILYRVATASNEFWIERIDLTGLSQGSWGLVSMERTYQIDDSDELQILLKRIISDKDFFSPLTEEERAALDTFLGESSWMIEIITEKTHSATMMNNIDGMTQEMIKNLQCRNFQKIVDAKSAIVKIFDNLLQANQ